MLSDLVALIAQTAAPAAPTTTPPSGLGSSGMTMLIGVMLFMMVFMILSSRGKRKEENKRKNQLDALTKNDRVMTIGGIIGTVVNVRDNEIVVKVDESNNTKMTFLKKAIQQVLKEGETPKMDK